MKSVLNRIRMELLIEYFKSHKITKPNSPKDPKINLNAIKICNCCKRKDQFQNKCTLKQNSSNLQRPMSFF